MAWLFRIPTLIHEQNVVPGQANALLAKIVKKIALSFGRSLRYVPARKAVVTGCPCRDAHPKEHRDELRRFFGFAGDAPVVMALGGSQGSQRINDIFFDALQMLIRHRKVCVIHITGAHDYERISRMSQGIPVQYRVFGFYDDIGKAYAIADCAVARAGAVTVVELDAFGIPAVLIPYPHAGGHQKHNALLLSEARGARIIDDAELTAEALARSIEQLLVRGRQSRPSTESEAVYMPDAARRIADEISRLK